MLACAICGKVFLLFLVSPSCSMIPFLLASYVLVASVCKLQTNVLAANVQAEERGSVVGSEKEEEEEEEYDEEEEEDDDDRPAKKPRHGGFILDEAGTSFGGWFLFLS